MEDHVRARVYEIGTCSGSISRVRHVLDDGARGGRGKRRAVGKREWGKRGSKKETSVFENGGEKLCVEQRNRKFIQSLITSRQRQHCSGVNNRAVLWVHVAAAAAAASIRPPDLQRLFAFLISLFSWEFRSPYRRHLAFSLPFPVPRPSGEAQKFTRIRVTISLLETVSHKRFLRGGGGGGGGDLSVPVPPSSSPTCTT